MTTEIKKCPILGISDPTTLDSTQIGKTYKEFKSKMEKRGIDVTDEDKVRGMFSGCGDFFPRLYGTNASVKDVKAAHRELFYKKFQKDMIDFTVSHDKCKQYAEDAGLKFAHVGEEPRGCVFFPGVNEVEFIGRKKESYECDERENRDNDNAKCIGVKPDESTIYEPL